METQVEAQSTSEVLAKLQEVQTQVAAQNYVLGASMLERARRQGAFEQATRAWNDAQAAVEEANAQLIALQEEEQRLLGVYAKMMLS